jgi:multidrug efflux pump subunit AcrA (membrane-fusion protein)
MKVIYTSLIFIICSISYAIASDELTLSSKQIQALGISSAALPPKSTGDLSGIPAQVVIPGNQLFVVSTPLPAMVEQTLVGVGDHVQKGQLLARLQSPALAEAQRGYLQANTQEQLARGNFSRDEQLWKDGIIAESRYRSAQSLYTEASATLAERKQQLVLAGMSADAISRLKTGENLNSLLLVTSPIGGVVLEKFASAGQRLDSAMPLFNVAQLLPLGLEIQAPLASTQGVREGAVVTIPAYTASGKITAIGHSLSNGNQTILLRALINKGTQNLRPGQHVDVSIATGSSASVAAQWNVANAALARIDGKVVVFVETPVGFTATPIKVLHEGAQQSLISGKLSGTEKIAVSGVSALKAKLMGLGGGE